MPAASTRATISPASPIRRPGFAADQPARLAGEILMVGARQPPEQLAVAGAGEPDLAFIGLAADIDRRDRDGAVAARGRGGAGERRRQRVGAEPVAPGAAGADQAAVGVGERHAERRPGAVERVAQQQHVGAGRAPPAPAAGLPRTSSSTPPAPTRPARKAPAKTGSPTAQSSKAAEASAGQREQDERRDRAGAAAAAADREGGRARHPYQMRTRWSGAR